MNSQRDHLRGPRGTRLRKTMWVAGLVLGGGVLGPAGAGPAVVRAQSPVVTAPASPPLVFDGVTVIDVQQGRRLPAQRVVIVGNRIRAMGSLRMVRVPAGAQVIDARGKYLIPGLWDMHTHAEHRTDLFYPLFLANGVTGIRDAGSEVPLDTLTMWRREILAGTRVGPPRQLLSGPVIDTYTPSCARGNQQEKQHLCFDGPADARHLVDSLKAAGADLIKVYSGVPRPLYFVIAAEARRLNIPFGGHLDFGQPSAAEASDSGASLLDHVYVGGLDTLCLTNTASRAQCRALAERFRRHGTWWVPTLVTVMLPTATEKVISSLLSQTPPMTDTSRLRHNWLRDNWLRDRREATAMFWRTDIGRTPLLSLVQRVGLPILAGTDNFNCYPLSFGLHAELAIYVGGGLTPLEALQTATLNPAKFLHGTDSLGTVAPGKLADLVLLDADPLADITNTTTIRAVVANGRYYDRVALDQLLAQAQALGKKVIDDDNACLRA